MARRQSPHLAAGVGQRRPGGRAQAHVADRVGEGDGLLARPRAPAPARPRTGGRSSCRSAPTPAAGGRRRRWRALRPRAGTRRSGGTLRAAAARCGGRAACRSPLRRPSLSGSRATPSAPLPPDDRLAVGRAVEGLVARLARVAQARAATARRAARGRPGAPRARAAARDTGPPWPRTIRACRRAPLVRRHGCRRRRRG